MANHRPPLLQLQPTDAGHCIRVGSPMRPATLVMVSDFGNAHCRWTQIAQMWRESFQSAVIALLHKLIGMYAHFIVHVPSVCIYSLDFQCVTLG